MAAVQISAQVRAQSKVWSGDLIGLQVDGLGLLAAPNFNGEPIPEYSENVSHLRISRGKKFSTADYRRCMFKIENEIGLKTDIVFGAVIRLTHHPSGMVLSAADCFEDADYEEPLALRGVQLIAPDAVNSDEQAHKWIVAPRYHLRDEGDPVNRNDYITIRNVQFQDLHLTSFVNPNYNTTQGTSFEDFVGLGPPLYVQYKPGLQVLIFRKCPLSAAAADGGGLGGDDDEDGGGGDAAEVGGGGGKSKKKGGAGGARKGKKKKKQQQRQKSEEEEEQEKLERSTVFSGDFVRLLHREHNGHFICRPDDEDALRSVVTPLGSAVRKRNLLNKHNSHGVFVRAQMAQQPLEPHDFPCALSSLGIWQVLSAEEQPPAEFPALHGMLKYSAQSIRLRHVATGLYLSVRPVQQLDAKVLKANSSFSVARQQAERKKQDLQTLQSAAKSQSSTLADGGIAQSPVGTRRRANAASMIELQQHQEMEEDEEGMRELHAYSADSAPDRGGESGSMDADPRRRRSKFGASASSDELEGVGRYQTSLDIEQVEDSFAAGEEDGSVATGATGRSKSNQPREGRNAATGAGYHAKSSHAGRTNVFISSITIDGMKNVDWAGKHFSGIQLRFGLQQQHSSSDWQFRTRTSDSAGNASEWKYLVADNSAHFSVDDDDIRNKVLEVKVNRMDSTASELPIGQSFLSLPSQLLEIPNGESVTCSIYVKDYKTGGDAGTITLCMVKNAIVTAEDEEEFHQAQDSGNAAASEVDHRELDFGEEESDAEEHEREESIRKIDWVVGTSMYPDRFTRFDLMEIDLSDDDNAVVNYSERLVLVHHYTKRHLSLNTMSLLKKSTETNSQLQSNQSKRATWWQYQSDIPLTPSAVLEDSILDSEVCQFDRVSTAEVKDLMYCARFIAIAKACTAALQLTPQVASLYFPMYRHFSTALSTLALWTLGAVDSEATLCPSENHPQLLYGSSPATAPSSPPRTPRTPGGNFQRSPAAATAANTASNSLAPNGAATFAIITEESPESKDEGDTGSADLLLDTDDVDHDLHSAVQRSQFAKPAEERASDLSGDDTSSSASSKSSTSQRRRNKSNSIARLVASSSLLDNPNAWKLALSSKIESKATRNRVNSAISADLTAAAIREEAEQEARSTISSLAPFLGRPLLLGTAYWPEANRPARPALQEFVVETLREMVERDSPANQKIVRRQAILMESSFLELCLFFLEITFMLQRTLQLTGGTATSTNSDPDVDADTEEAGPAAVYSTLPHFLLDCCSNIHFLIRSAIYKNEKAALGILAIHGSFLSMVSQKIVGWDPPLETILKLTCRDVEADNTEGAGSAAEEASSGDRQQQVVFERATNAALKAAGKTPSVAKTSAADSDRHRSEGKKEASSGGAASIKSLRRSLPIENILAESISSSDILQIVQLMHSLHQLKDPAALQILNLLIMLCRSGRARRHFQNLLVRAIVRNDIEEYSLWGECKVQSRPSSMQSNCVLFYSRFDSNQWEVKFRYPFAFPSQEEKNQLTLQRRVRTEATCLKKVFFQYNDDNQSDDNVLDLSESFRLLEDLGLGGPFLYRELEHLEGSSIQGFLDWHSYRFSFLYPTSANSYCQMSPYQALLQLHPKLSRKCTSIEMQRQPLRTEDIASSVNYLEVLNSRMEAFHMRFEEDSDVDAAACDKNKTGVRKALAAMRKALTRKRFEFADQFSSSFRSPSSGAAMVSYRDLSKQEGRWFEFVQAFDADCEDHKWFQRSLILLGELCKLGNSYCQRLVSVVLPAECLLEALQARGVIYENRAIVLQLVSHIYVHHDLVYPTRCLPLFTPVGFCGHNEEIFNPQVAIGQVFNALSRVKFDGEGAEEGAQLRRLLFDYMTRSLLTLNLFSQSRAEERFKEELLSLFVLLFGRGFFQDPDFEFFPASDAEVNTEVRLEEAQSSFDRGLELLGLSTTRSAAERPNVASSSNAGRDSRAPATKKGTYVAKFAAAAAATATGGAAEVHVTIDSLQQMLVRKLNELTLLHQCTKDFSISFIPEDEHNSRDALQQSEPGFSPADRSLSASSVVQRYAKRRKGMRRHKKKPVATSAERARQLAWRRSSMDNVRRSFSYFDDHFGDTRNSATIHMVVKILAQLHDARQLVRIQKSWNFINNAVDATTERSYSKNVENLSQYLPRIRFDRFVEAAFQVYKHHEATPGYTQALFFASTYGNFELRRSCFQLMNRQLCIVRDAHQVFSSLVLLPDAHQALMYRLMAIYSQQLIEYTKTVLQRPSPLNAFYLEKVNFAIENIRSLCFSDFLDLVDRGDRRPRHAAADSFSMAACCGVVSASRSKARSGSSSIHNAADEGASGIAERKAPKVTSYSGRALAPILYKPEQDPFNYLMHPIPCPAGQDDFFELDVDRIVGDEQQLIELCNYYELFNQEVGDCEIAEDRARINCEQSLGAVSLQLLTALLRHLKAPHFIPWDAMYDAEKFVFDQVLELLADIGRSSPKLCSFWFDVFSDALVRYFPQSTAAGSLILLLLRHCRDVAVHPESSSFAELVLLAIEENGLLQAVIYPKMICALLVNPQREAVELGARHLLSRIQLYASHFDFRLPPSVVCEQPDARDQLYHLLRPLSLILNLKVKLDISPSVIAAMRVVFSVDFCSTFLSSSTTPLILKSDLIALSSALHADAFLVEDIVLTDLRNMRTILRLNVDVDFEGCSTYCVDFLCRGVAVYIREQILRSSILTATQVNDQVYLAISSAVWTGGIPNRAVAHVEAEQLRRTFAVIFPASAMEAPLSAAGATAAAAGDRNRNSKTSVIFELEPPRQRPVSDNSDSVLAYSIFQAALLVINVLKERDGFLMSKLSEVQRFDIIWVAAAVEILLKRHAHRVVNPKGGLGVQDSYFRGVAGRLSDVLAGMVAEILAKRTEAHIRNFYTDAVVQKAKEDFHAVASAAPQKASASLLRRARGGGGAAQLERSRFAGSMSIAVNYPIEYLMASPPARFLIERLQEGAHFLDMNGKLLFGDFRSPVIKSKAFVRRFSNYTDFDLWMKGSGRYLQSVMSYLGKVTEPGEADYNLLHMVTGLLNHSIEDIRDSRLLSLSLRIVLLDRETARLRRLQLAMKDFGALALITKLLGKCNQYASENFVWSYAPLTLSLANAIISWQNTECQELIIDSIETGIARQKPPDMNCLVGLQFMIRKCTLALSYTAVDAGKGSSGFATTFDGSEEAEEVAGAGHFPQGEQTRILRSVRQLFLFVGAFCKGDNAAAQAFFSAQDSSSRLYVDLIQELAQLANAVFTKFCATIEYIRYEEFYDRVGPLVWEQKDASRRRMLAWHHPKNNIALFAQFLSTISSIFDSMVSMCNERTVVSIQQAIGKCPDILEFTGLMQLMATSLVPSVNAVGLEVQRPVYWHCGDPFKFYRVYFHELQSAEILEGDPDLQLLNETVEQWHQRKGHSARSLLGQKKFLDGDFKCVFGVSRELFLEHVRKTESRCLSVIQAFFAFAPVVNIVEMSTKFNDGILLAQLNNTFEKIQRDSANRDSLSATTVSYLSILEKISVHFPETGELLLGWEQGLARRGLDPKKVFGAVEIIGKQGKVQRLYFPIPNFVLCYWPYPEVQKMKDRIVQQVSRASPEEKLADFRQWMDRIIKVMKRQELLRTWLTFPLHMIFGGKSVGFLRYFPSKRLLALLLTLLLNIYYVYFTSLPKRFDPADGSIANYLVSSNNKNINELKPPGVLESLKLVLLGLNLTMFLSKMLNSYALSNLFETVRSKYLLLDLLLKILVSPYAAFLVVVDALWELILVALSFVGSYFDLFWFYAPMLLDVAFQLRFMRFLFDAVALNGIKITYTMLLAFLILYFYAVIATLYFNGQYDLDGHFGCNNVVACFKLHLDYGIDNVPNWQGDFYIDPELPLSFLYGPLLSRMLGTAYSLSYVILINLVLTSIISGLIIDTFGQLREENEIILQDIADKCFVCSILRDDFEQEAIPFRTHIKEEHNMWHYVWFKIYLDSKDPLSYTSAEIHAAENMKDKSSFIQLMPIKKSLTIEQKSGEDEEEEQLEDTLEDIIQLLNKSRTQQQGLAKSIKTLRKSSARLEEKIAPVYSQSSP